MDKTKDKLYLEYVNKHREEINQIWDNVDSLSFLKHNHTFDLDNVSNLSNFFLRKIETTYILYFKSCNGYIGRDLQLLYESLFNTKIYHYMIKDEIDVEIDLTNNFYTFLMCLYNIKDKFLGFIGAYNKGKDIIFYKPDKEEQKSSTVLNKTGQQKIDTLFKSIYPTIMKYITARNLMVHDNYVVSYSKNIDCIKVSNFGFNLRNNSNNKNIKNSIFKLDNEELNNLIRTIYSLREQFCKITYDIENIDMDLYKKTFQHDDGSITIKF